jgi:nitric oxide synthase-interacting protein
MCCPQGHLYCRECIFESLLTQKQEIKRKIQEYEAQEKRKEEETKHTEAEKEEREIFEFTKVDTGLLPQKFKIWRAGKGGVRPSFIPAEVESFVGPDGHTYYLDKEYKTNMDKKQQFEAMSTIRRQIEMAKGLPSFWVPSKGPEAIVEDMKKPSEETMCIEGNHPLRLKQLIKVHFHEIKAPGSGGDITAVKQCPICRKEFTNSRKIALLKGCGHVVCMQCVTDYVSKERKCFVCTQPAGEKDVIKLQEGGTGYVDHGSSVLSKKATPAAWV